MTQKEFLDKLQLAHDVPNYYNNVYPYNCGYYDGEKFSFDCWNLVKAILGGWTDNRTKGYFISPSKFPTGDCTGAGLLKQCHDCSKDFSKLSIPGTYLYLSDHPHAGVYVGDKKIDGKIYNVIECTGAWQGGVLYSYVDSKGRRFQYKGGSQVYTWTDYGLLPYVEYQQVVNTDNKLNYITYIVTKGDTLSKISREYGVPVKIIAGINDIADPNIIHTGQRLMIPLQDAKVYHIVKKGETLSGIAKKYGTNYIKLALLNGIVNPNKINVGQRIRVR